MKKRRKNSWVISRLSEVLSLKVKCGNCENVGDYDRKDVSLISDSAPCETCGEHGSVIANLTCSSCKVNLIIIVETW